MHHHGSVFDAEDTVGLNELNHNDNLLHVNRNVARQRSASTPELDDVKLYATRKRTPSTCQALKHAVLTLYRLDDFIQENLGNGYFSVVYKVTHTLTGEVMVLKMNRPNQENNRPNVLREVQLMNKMNHPNILKFLGVCVHQGTLHALSEYINGGSLHDVIVEDDLTWIERVQLSIDIASGMNYLHSEGVFHRDLTSRNILIKVDGTNKKAVVGDFGLVAKIPDRNADVHLPTVGTPYWMSPECIKGLKYDERSDIFSFGIILCEMIAKIDADPDVMPRTENFGLDYVAFSSLAPECPLHYLYLAFRCCQMDPNKRPNFSEIIDCLKHIRDHRLQAQPNSIAARSNITAGHVRRHIRRFNKDSGHKRSRSAGQTLDFLKTDSPYPSQPTAQFIGEHMTREDPFYKPASSESFNPFDSDTVLRGGQKILAADPEDLDLSLTLPHVNIRTASRRQTFSLPADCNKETVDKIFGKMSETIESSQSRRLDLRINVDDDNESIDSALGTASQRSNKLLSPSADHNKQLNLECAMIFCGLDLINISKHQNANSGAAAESSDLESEFQDDLEDVLRSCSSSESRISNSIDDYALSPSLNSTGDMDQQWWLHVDKNDPSCRYFHPTLIEKRRSLRRVEMRNKDKLEQLQQKIDRLRKRTGKKLRQSSACSN